MKGVANTSPMAKAIITALSLDAELVRKSIASRLNSGKESMKEKVANNGLYAGSRAPDKDFYVKRPKAAKSPRKRPSASDALRL